MSGEYYSSLSAAIPHQPDQYPSNLTTLERIDKDNAMLLVVDTRIGLFEVVVTSHLTRPNGPLPKKSLRCIPPSAPLIKCQNDVNAWDNADFHAAVKSTTGKNKSSWPGSLPTVCTTFLALFLIEEDYTVCANHEASGAASRRIADEANARE
ncbi:hypothetical protein F5050DRAFT_1807720 [Lentinula boryana]|uniref:Uncharacterized protein n=1 Tax=Lentinula boryana TaxID=40481 RepID=A0ABQ8QDF9_9AGAR|nr:hypothetical protein F5050DRAFT_1807720 [Lentinula boryana]